MGWPCPRCSVGATVPGSGAWTGPIGRIVPWVVVGQRTARRRPWRRACWRCVKNCSGAATWASTARPRGWFLPDLAAGRVELDSFDFIEDLRLERGPFLHVFNAISLHGGLCASWPGTQMAAKTTVLALQEHWRSLGLPRYAKFDNDSVFQGTHRFADAFGRVIRLCLSLGVTPVFAPPGEHGFQADI